MGNAFSCQTPTPLIKVQPPYSYALVPAHTLYPDRGDRYNNRHGRNGTYYILSDRYYTSTPLRSPPVAPIYTPAPGTPARRHAARPPRRMASPRAERVPDFRELGRDHRGYPPPLRPAKQFPGDPLLGACFCTRECRCRKGNWVLFRTRNGDGRTEDGEHRYVPKEEGRNCEGRNCDGNGVCGDDDGKGRSKGGKGKGKRGNERRGSGYGDDSDDGDDGCQKATIGAQKLDRKLSKGLGRVDDRLNHITDRLGHISGGLDQLSWVIQRGGNGRGRQYLGGGLGGAFNDNESYGDDDFGGIRPSNRRDPRGARVFGRGPGYSLQRPSMVRNSSNLFDSLEIPAYGGMERTRGNGAQSRGGKNGRGGRSSDRHIPGRRIPRNPMPGGGREDGSQFTMHGGRNSMPYDLDGGPNDADPEPNDNWTDIDIGTILAELPQHRRTSPPGRPRRPGPSRHQSTQGRAQRRGVPPRNAYAEDVSESI